MIRFDDLVYAKKQLTMRLSLASEINVLAAMLDRLSEKNRWYRDFTLNALTAAVREVIACFPVYRTYLEPGHDRDGGRPPGHLPRRRLRETAQPRDRSLGVRFPARHPLDEVPGERR